MHILVSATEWLVGFVIVVVVVRTLKGDWTSREDKEMWRDVQKAHHAAERNRKR